MSLRQKLMRAHGAHESAHTAMWQHRKARGMFHRAPTHGDLGFVDTVAVILFSPLRQPSTCCSGVHFIPIAYPLEKRCAHVTVIEKRTTVLNCDCLCALSSSLSCVKVPSVQGNMWRSSP